MKILIVDKSDAAKVMIKHDSCKLLLCMSSLDACRWSQMERRSPPAETIIGAAENYVVATARLLNPCTTNGRSSQQEAIGVLGATRFGIVTNRFIWWVLFNDMCQNVRDIMHCIQL